MSHSIAIRCQQVTKLFGTVKAVSNLNLTLMEGRFLALLGPSGCGKTTTLRMVAGFEPPDQGTIEIGEQMVAGPGIYTPPEKRSVGMVFQEYALFPHLNVFDNVAYGLPKGVDKKQRVQEALALVNLPNIEKRMPYELSGGQQQRVALARAIAPQPTLILLDEPFSNLDAGLRVQVRAEVRQILRQVKATALFVTHDQEEALSLADDVAVMMDGHLVQMDSPTKLYQRPINRAVATFLGEANFITGRAFNGQVECELGQLKTTSIHNGPVEIMLRPEELHLTLDNNGPAEIITREYYGHDQLLQLRLNSGTPLKSRLLGFTNNFTPGQRVSLQVRDSVVVYPISDTSPTLS